MAKRKSTGKRLRFSVFERDNFTCQYCGKRTPDVVLHVDHIYPVSKGGTDDIENLITSCADCNLGKATTELGKAPKQVSKHSDDLKEKYEQLKAFYNLQKKVDFVRSQIIQDLQEYWGNLWKGYRIAEIGLASVRRFLKTFAPNEIKDAMDIAKTKMRDPDSAFRYTCGVLHTITRERKEGIIR